MLNFRGDVLSRSLPLPFTLPSSQPAPRSPRAVWPLRKCARALYLIVAILGVLLLATREAREPAPSKGVQRQYLQGRKILIAANYFNNMDLLDAHCDEMALLLDALVLAGATPYVSVYENGSKDETPAFLREWQRRLDERGIANTINIDDAPSWSTVFEERKKNGTVKGEDEMAIRIGAMADIRNKALAPLDASFDDVLFFNDVIFLADDILRLLLTGRMEYDVVCSMDFNRITFYDTWVARDVNAERMASLYPFSADIVTQGLIAHGRPFPVSSCWNGVVAMKAAPFLKHKIQFRTWQAQEPRLLGRPSALQGVVYNDSCPASECLLVFEDLSRFGYNRFYMHPTVHVTYSSVDWVLHRTLGGALNLIASWTLTLQPHGRVPPGHRIPQCGLAREVTLQSWVIPATLCLKVIVAWRVLRWVRPGKLAVE
ncbi:hypothetical protein SDRG_01418 [Saprolegnia diclina VS20]|uniref:Uncharacterized protein n=1 Tax=Saprolegnia diclina (strain VS20) TaxID=1156394 RepID=T0R520_SAPDV|nr:hypothetical protein SDRG_01418 [Saprolegnia diclina VS20]EQC41450.1 hypothetical protein SDRG_01418 [Saprolegnia diclina VS20]|eukprot:XP_008605164.1 hypothetical protein SDRG_01418 [Saprolegnia diclina VS20]